MFSQVPDKQKGWNDLIKLTSNRSHIFRISVLYVLDSAFSHLPDKEKTLKELVKLTNSEDNDIRAYANHSLGKLSIIKASNAENEEEYRKNLESSIEFFEEAAKESEYFNPSQFCLPFYRSFHTIIFKRQETKREVEKYLIEAKNAVKGSKSKELLFEAVENLANALKEIQNLKNLDFDVMKNELNFYRKYCDRAAELMKDTDERAPFATEVLRKGLPILDRNLKGLIEEIQQKAKIACNESIGTATEEIACAVSKEVLKWEMGTEEEMIQKIENLIFILKSKISNIPENKFIFDKIEEVRHERNITKQYETVALIIGAIPTQVSSDKLKIREELVITTGVQLAGTGAQHVVTIPLQEISYSDLMEDLRKIKEKGDIKFSDIPGRLAEKLKGYLGKNKMDHILEEGYMEISTESRSVKK